MNARTLWLVALACCLILVAPACRKEPPGTKLRVDTSLDGQNPEDLSRAVCANSFEGKTQEYHLDKISIWLDNCGGGSGSTVTLYVQQYPPTASGNVLATASQPSPSAVTAVDFEPRDTSGNRISIPVGQTFYIRLETSPPGPCWLINRNSTRAILDGTAFKDGTALTNLQTNSPHVDFCFKLYSEESFAD